MKYQAVVIGGSSGAIEVVINILAILGPVFPLPLIIVLHRHKNVESSLDTIIQMRSNYQNLKEADEKEFIQNKFAYIAPPNYHLLIEEDKSFTLDDSEPVNYSRPSIDVTFESAAMVYKEKLVGVLLSGANTDGAVGMKSINSHGGLTIVQDPHTAESVTMPKAAIATTHIDLILNIKDITLTLQKIL